MSAKVHEHRTDSKVSQRSGITLAGQPSPKVSLSQEERHKLIEVRAYELWERAGKPDGDEERIGFWCEAENAIASSDSD